MLHFLFFLIEAVDHLGFLLEEQIERILYNFD